MGESDALENVLEVKGEFLETLIYAMRRPTHRAASFRRLIPPSTR
jgi:hypothetical protein